MNYNTTLTSKGTITILSPLRKALNLKSGQKLTLTLGEDNNIILNTGTDIKSFAKTRSRITKNIPARLKGLSDEALNQARGNSWVDDIND